MIWAVVSVLIVSLAINVLLSVLVFRVSSTQADVLDRSHERTTEYTAALLDRLMARDWLEYKAIAGDYQVAEGEEPEPLVVTVPGPDRGGFGSRLGVAAWSPPEEINPEEEMP